MRAPSFAAALAAVASGPTPTASFASERLRRAGRIFLFSRRRAAPSATKTATTTTATSPTALSMSSFFSDSSDYSSSESDYISGDDDLAPSEFSRRDGGEADVEEPVVEHGPVPMSKNGGNRFVAFVFDRELDVHGRDDVRNLHDDRVALTEDHVLFCRKANLYDPVEGGFNSESMADVVWSHQILSADLQRVVGHAMCIESTALSHVRDLLSRDPIVRSLIGDSGDDEVDASSVPLYRWRHLRDHTLRQDDGRNGRPTLALCLDRSAEEGVGATRDETADDHLEYLIRSERVIAAGSLHLPTEFKDDPSSLPVGDFVLFNAENRTDAIEFVENDPAARAGLYSSMRVNRYNSLDVTGKFVVESEVFPRQPCCQMKEAMGIWGYPVKDEETPWINW